MHRPDLPIETRDTYLAGYRCWRFVRPGYLMDLGNTQLLEPRVRAEAFCRIKDHLAPDPACKCGFYAHKSKEENLFEFGRLQSAFGKVALWGRVVECGNGYRAQFMYPLRLWTYDVEHGPNDIMPYTAYLSDLYGVPFDVLPPPTIEDSQGEFLLAPSLQFSQPKPLTLPDLIACAISPDVPPEAAHIANTKAQQRLRQGITRIETRIANTYAFLAQKEQELKQHRMTLKLLQDLRTKEGGRGKI